MDLTDINNTIGYPEPIQMPVSELTTGAYIFNIPSFQRGYRWESDDNPLIPSNDVKQVDDLLEDLTAFIKSNPRGGNYYLQPLMVKPRKDAAFGWVWDVLDGQQRLTTIWLILKCLDEKLHTSVSSSKPLFKLIYEKPTNPDFSKITFDSSSVYYNYPLPSTNLDSFFIKKAKDRIDYWFKNVIASEGALQRGLDEMLFDPDPNRVTNTLNIGTKLLRAIFIWYNVEPVIQQGITSNGNRIRDIEIFNRLNRGKISLTNSELIKALFLLCLKVAGSSYGSVMNSDTLVRTWDEMERKLQNNDLWGMICPKYKSYSNRMDLLFDFIKDLNGAIDETSYRYYHKKMHEMTTGPNPALLETLWNEIKFSFDKLCKWHEDTAFHNRIGFLVDCGETVASISLQLKSGVTLTNLISLKLKSKKLQSINDLESLQYDDDGNTIRKILLLFNVLTCDKYGQKFPFGLYRDNSYDIEHVNSQTDNPIEKLDEKRDWIINHAFSCLKYDRLEMNSNGKFTQSAKDARELIIEGIGLLKNFKRDGSDTGDKFKKYRSKVESYYAYGSTDGSVSDEKDSIGNLTLLNSSINREYKNALFPLKLRILKRSDQEGAYIPLCTKYMFLKYYSNVKGNESAFNMMRWRERDQKDYVEAIKNALKNMI